MIRRRSRKERKLITRPGSQQRGIIYRRFEIQKHNTGNCNHRGEDETINNVIPECMNYETQ